MNQARQNITKSTKKILPEKYIINYILEIRVRRTMTDFRSLERGKAAINSESETFQKSKIPQ